MTYIEVKKEVASIFETPVRNVSIKSKKLNGVAYDTIYILVQNDYEEPQLVKLGYHDGRLIWVSGDVFVSKTERCKNLLHSIYGL